MIPQDTIVLFQNLLRDVSNKIKNHNTVYEKQKNKYPEFYDGYNIIVEQYESILVHAEKGKFPEKLFSVRNPNQTKDEYEYLKANYKQHTLPVYIDLSNSVKRCWNDGNWDIIYPDESNIKDIYKGENSLREYIENGMPVFKSLENYFRYLYPDLKLKDANGLTAIRPENISLEKNEIDGSLEYKLGDGMVKPVVYYYNCKQVVRFEEDKWYLIHLNEKSKLQNNIEGNIFELWTKHGIYRAIQVGKYEKFDYKLITLYQHDLGFVPAKKHMGIPFFLGNTLMYQSPFLFAVDNLDLVAINSSNLQLSMDNCTYPIRVMIGDECDFTDQATGARCRDGKIFINGTSTTCSACQGSGLKTRLSRVGTILIRPKSDQNEQEIKPSDAIYFASPSTETLAFIDGKIKSEESKARGILHVKNNAEQGVGENVVESSSNTKSNYAFIKPISDQIFSKYQWSIDTTGKYREGDAYQQITVIPPLHFDFLNEKDYLEQITSATQSGQPPFVIHTLIFKFLNSLFYNNVESAKRFALIVNADRLLVLGSNEINQGLLNETVAPWESLLHQSSISLVGELERSIENIYELDISEQVSKLHELAKSKQLAIAGVNPVDTFFNNRSNSLAGNGQEN